MLSLKLDKHYKEGSVSVQMRASGGSGVGSGRVGRGWRGGVRIIVISQQAEPILFAPPRQTVAPMIMLSTYSHSTKEPILVDTLSDHPHSHHILVKKLPFSSSSKRGEVECCWCDLGGEGAMSNPSC